MSVGKADDSQVICLIELCDMNGMWQMKKSTLTDEQGSGGK